MNRKPVVLLLTFSMLASITACGNNDDVEPYP